MYGVTSQMIDTYGDIVLELSLNKQRRVGDPIRKLDWQQIEAQREGAGLSDAQIAARTGMREEQARYIRVVMERRRFRRDQYRKLFRLGIGHRYREETYQDIDGRPYGEDSMQLREAMQFDPTAVRDFVKSGNWRKDTLSGWLSHWVEETPDRPALFTSDTAMTYGDLQAKVQSLAGGLHHLGVGQGEVVSVQLPNVSDYMICYLAIASLGAVMSTIHMPYRAHEFEPLLRHSRAKAVICLTQFKDYPTAQEMMRLRDEITTLEHVICLGPPMQSTHSLSDLMAHGPVHMPLHMRAPVASDPMLLLYTSGTSSSPKGVPLSYQNMLSNAYLSVAEHQLAADDVLLSAAPFSHLFGLYSIHLALAVGASCLLLPAFTPHDLATTLDQHKPTILFAAPAHIAACLEMGAFNDKDLSSLKLVIMSGSACPPDLFPAFSACARNSQLTQLWGMTELQAGLYTRPHDPLEVAAYSAGRPSPGTEVRLVDDHGHAVAANEEGHLQVRGCSVFPGYYDNSTANEAAFTADGWFRSGDLAVMDHAGNVRLTGRSKDIIDRGGVKFNPLDIETLIDQHPKVMLSAIVPMPDPVLGERACCFATLAAGVETFELDELVDYLLTQNIAKNKLPERLVIIEDMPLTPTRKIIKGRLELPD